MAKASSNRITNEALDTSLLITRTDGRTNERITHLPESSSVPERAGEMRILTVRQPWAWAIIFGQKDVENRVRNIAGGYRGLVALHVGKAAPEAEDILAVERLMPGVRKGLDWMAHMAFTDTTLGHIIGVVDLVGVHRGPNTETDRMRVGKPFGPCSPWADPDAWHLELANPYPLTEPIPFRGALGLRRLPEDVAGQVFQRIGRTA